MLVPRSQMGCVVLDDHLYVLGGTNRHNEVLQVRKGKNIYYLNKLALGVNSPFVESTDSSHSTNKVHTKNKNKMRVTVGRINIQKRFFTIFI